ncbi:MAG TPA: cell division protein SepF [Actinomadura sp.]|jgi:FtsZ-interacting cell division protein YlmF|nr:cell division protein SepF [Actinomadura sp.]
MAGLLRKAMLSFGLTDEPLDFGEQDDEAVVALPAPARRRRPHIVTLHARQFNNDAPVIGDLFRTGATVIIDLSGTDEPTLTRFLDFGAGLAFGHGGRIEKVAPSVLLLTPQGVAA